MAICNGTIAESCWKWTPIAAPQLLQLGENRAAASWSAQPLVNGLDPSMPDGFCGKMWIEDMWKMIVDHQHQYSPVFSNSLAFTVDVARIVSRSHHGGSQEGMAAVFAALWLSWMLM